MEFAHLGVEIHGFVAVDEFDVFARHERPALGFDFVERGGVAVFGNVFVRLFVPFALPVVEIFGDLSNLLRGKLNIFFLKRFAPLAQIDEKDFILAGTVFDGFAILHDGARLAVARQNPKRDADVRGIEHVARKNDDGFDEVVFEQATADGELGPVAGKCAVGEEEARSAVSGELGDDVEDPTVVGVACGRDVVAAPARIVAEFVVGAPGFLVKRRICHDEPPDPQHGS